MSLTTIHRIEIGLSLAFTLMLAAMSWILLRELVRLARAAIVAFG